MPYRSVNPATGEVLKTFPEHTDEQMWGALATADKAFRVWAARPFQERSKIVGRAAQILLERKEELARLATLEMGKRISESRGEVELSASIIQYFADKAEVFLASKELDSPMGDARLEYSPFGVLQAGVLWARRSRLSGQGRRRRHCDRQRFAVRPWRVGLQHRRRKSQASGKSYRYRHGFYQLSRCQPSGAAFWRY